MCDDMRFQQLLVHVAAWSEATLWCHTLVPQQRQHVAAFRERFESVLQSLPACFVARFPGQAVQGPAVKHGSARTKHNTHTCVQASLENLLPWCVKEHDGVLEDEPLHDFGYVKPAELGSNALEWAP